MNTPELPTISVLIGTKNRPEALATCLESILRQTHPILEILVLDDGSDTPIKSQLASQFSSPIIQWQRTNESLGVAGGRNLLMRQAKGDVVCIIDDDALFVEAGALEVVARSFADDPNLGILAGKVIDFPETGQRVLAPFPKRIKVTKPELFNRRTAVSYFQGGCHAIRKSMLDVCGYYHAEFVFGEEELDMSYRTIEANYGIVYDPSFLVHHFPRKSVVSNSKENSAESLDELCLHVANRIVLAYKYIPVHYLGIYLSVWMLRYLGNALLKGKLKSYFLGVSRGLKAARNVVRRPLSSKAQIYIRNNFGRIWY